MNISKVNIAVRNAIAFGSVLTFSSMPSASAEEVIEKQVERITITGSKIKRIGEISPTPITVISGDALVNAGVINVADLLNELPSSAVGLSSETTNDTSFANGLSNTNLRGLGIAKTLVLVNGRRFVAGSTESSAVDLNNIPTAIVDRIEITTGGASAVYGSDAVAGVVNIITKKSIEGFELDISTTKPTENGGNEKYVSFTFGSESEKSRFIANVSYSSQEQLAGNQRDFIVNGPMTIDNVDNVDNADGIPRRSVWKNGNSKLGFYSKYGDFWGYNNGAWVWSAFDENGTARPFEGSDPFPLSSTPGSTNGNYFAGEGDGYHFLDHTYLRTPLKRLNITTNYNFEINDDHTMNVELLYADTSAYGEMSPTFQARQIQPDNAFLTDQAKEYVPWWAPTWVYFTSDALGNRKFDQQRTTLRGAVSLEGMLNDDWTYDAHIQLGQVKQDTAWEGEIITENFVKAIDAVEWNGSIVCADRDSTGAVIGAVSGCSPLNLWGKGLASQEAIDYTSTTPTQEAVIDQTSAGITVTGDLFELFSGPVSSAFTVEYREEKLVTTPSRDMAQGLIFGNQTGAQNGKYDVTEAAVEVSIPLLSDSPFADELYLDLAYRYMDYSSTGTDDAWKVSLNYVLNDEFKMRANMSRSVRAPNIVELFASSSIDYNNFGDPCGQGAIDNAPLEKQSNREANCRAAGIPAGWEPSDNWQLTTHPGTTSGNQNLSPEVADDVTVGFVYNPSWLEDSSMTVDYWKFEIVDEIVSQSASTIVNGCYDSDSLDNSYCGLIERTQGSLDIDNYFVKPINAATTDVSGIDIEFNYSLDTSWGTFSPRLLATYLIERDGNPTGVSGDEKVYAGVVSEPRWKATFVTNYTLDDFSATLAVNYRHSTVADREWEPEQNDYNDIPSYTTVDLTARYQINEAIEVRAGVLNLFDRAPPHKPSSYNQGAYFDLLGQRLNLGIKLNF